jgi:polyisoprenyl-teichoic acid--peptidoglycan teichoic acid transferase
MNGSPSPERRPLDGPIRRLPVQPAAAPEPVETPPAQPAEPVFEYRKPKKRRNWLRWLAWGLAAVVLLVLAWFGYQAFTAVHKIIGKGGAGAPALAGKLDLTHLKGEGDGRVNILFLGIGGPGHEGPDLSDTIMVMSIDPKSKDVAMLSIPRDLYVRIPGKWSTKINAANALGGPELAKKTVQQVIGVPIHYYLVADFAGFRQAIDAVGGIDIDVKQAIYDPDYPCETGNGYCALSIKAGMQHMNGTLALKYARCRKSASCGGDFGRAARQQEVLLALRHKALSISTLTNPVKMTELINSVGDHVRTDLQLAEMKKLADIAKDIDTTKVVSKVLDYGRPESLLIDGAGMIDGAGSIELPKAGTFDYSEIQDFVKNIFADGYIIQENARIEVQNGSGVAGVAGKIVTSLLAAHYNVADPVNAPEQSAKTVIYDYSGGKKPYTINYLEQRFGVKAQRMAAPQPSSSPAATPAPAIQIRIIIGSDYKPASSPG